jgi:hypothetical protein
LPFWTQGVARIDAQLGRAGVSDLHESRPDIAIAPTIDAFGPKLPVGCRLEQPYSLSTADIHICHII